MIGLTLSVAAGFVLGMVTYKLIESIILVLYAFIGMLGNDK